MTGADAVIAPTKFKIKISALRIEAVPEARSGEFGQELPLVSKWSHGSCRDGKDHSMQNLTVPGSKKRGPSWVVENQSVKRQKMDRAVTQQCCTLVKDLIKHKYGWGFALPVDPVKLNLPDYFSIISHPMDLGTIKSKLEKNLYVDTEEFAADIRLTFSNAMLYNPLTNDFHIMAKSLNDYFERRWKSLEDNWNCQRLKFGGGKLLNGSTKRIGDMRQHCPETPPAQTVALPKKLKLPEQVKKNSLDTVTAEVKIIQSVGNCVPKPLEQISHKGIGRHADCSVNAKSILSPVAGKNITCGWSTSNSTQASSDITFAGSAEGDQHACSTDTSKLDCKAKSMLASQLSKSDPDSDGAVSALDDGNMCHSSQHTSSATDVTSGEGWEHPLDVQLSPTKALRAAMLKQRFAETILKAQHKTLLDQVDKADPLKLQQERERLERMHREEKARIEAQLKAAEAASRRKEEIEMKKQREREREAARIALQKMEQTAEIEQNLEILKELEMLSGCSLSYNFRFYGKGAEAVKGRLKGSRFRSPLERFGLFMKDDIGEDDDDEDTLHGAGEEGEILS